MAVHVGSHFGSHPAPPVTRLLSIEQNFEFRKRDQGIPVLATEPVKIANGLNLAAFF
jgi:hypothetical protein